MPRVSQTRRNIPSVFIATALSAWLTMLVCTGSTSFAQESEPAQLPNQADELAIQQSRLAEQHARLEKLLLRMAEFDAASNPRRAELLKKTFALSKEKDIQLRLDSLSRLLNQEQFKRALSGQKLVRSDLNTLLDLLLSENRADRLKDEQARIKDYIKEIERLERIQRSVQGRNEGGVDTERLIQEQQRLADRTESLNDMIQENEGDSSAPSENNGASESAENEGQGDESEKSQPSESDPEGSETQDSDSSEKNPSEPGSPSSGDAKPSDSESSDSESGDPTESSESPGSPSAPGSESQPGQESPESTPGAQDQAEPQPFPGQKKVQEAEQRMRDAQEKLEDSKRDKALADQREAARNLAEAKAELEEILRQMREEEIERTLAQLEGRVRKMLEMQLQVHETTIRIARRQAEDADRSLDIEAGKLSFQERRIVVEADKCLAVLREEGSSVAFPASMESIREDMEEVTNRLARVKLGQMTQGLEEDIMEALEEMIEALQQAQLDQEQRQQNQQMQPPSDPGEQPLVSQIAELKMIKALQLRINRRTDRYAKMLDDVADIIGQATDEELIAALRGLSQRELDLHQITHDISLGKNK